ncbi:MAG: DAK2 domain-containing protein [Candidatus Aenigmarchaeota archaeon]|nr:DAK2 domain-containing protein [Candidatus Aenigmarchaeota archaeon]
MSDTLAEQKSTPRFKISGNYYRRTIQLAVKLLGKYRERLNQINVYPVPDGDTGNNLYLTIKGIWDDIKHVRSRDFGKIARLISDSALKNAQGNSGNILAMFLYGIYDYSRDKKYLLPEDLVYAFEKGLEHAYSAVENPREGTILTAMRVTVETAKKEIENGYRDYKKILKKCIDVSIEELRKSKVNIPQLVEYDVIDAGGLGFVILLQAWTDDVKEELILKLTQKKIEVKLTGQYCVNIMLKIEENKIEELKQFLETVSNSIVLKKISDKVKLHFHCAIEAFDDIMMKIFDLGEVVSQQVSLA